MRLLACGKAYTDVSFIEIDLAEGYISGGREAIKLLLMAQTNSFTKIGLCILQMTLNEGLKSSYVGCGSSQTVASLQCLQARCEDLLYDHLM